MKCVLCKNGQTETGRTTVTLQRGETIVIIKDVPAEICRNCREDYLSEPIADRVFELAEDAVKKNVEVEIIRFAA
ncbi:type II toxin-antitoxin system MqsA family antitoxin [Thermodesulfobacteriota bacterium]